MMGKILHVSHSKWVRVLTALALIGILSSSFIGGWNVYQSKQLLEDKSRLIIWPMMQLQEEMRRFISTLKLYEFGGATQEQLLFRYNILWSRFPILLQGNDSPILDGVNGGRSLVMNIFDEVKRIEPVLEAKSLTHHDVVRIYQWLGNYLGPVNVIVNREFHRVQDHHTLLHQRLDQRQNELNWAFSILTLSVLLLLGLMLEQMRQNWKARFFDFASGMYNQRYIKQYIERELAKTQALSTIGISFDLQALLSGRFNSDEVKDVQAHCYRLLRHIFENTPYTLARLSKYKFVAVTSNVDSLATVLEQLQTQSYRPFSVGEKVYRLPLKVTVIDALHHYSKASEALLAQEIAFVQSAHESQWVHYYRPEWVRQKIRTLCLSEHLQEALEQEDIKLLFQPILRVRQSLPVALHTRIRWIDSDYGHVEFAELIELAASQQLSKELREQFIYNALRQHRQWQAELKHPLWLILPLPLQWIDDSFVELLPRWLKTFAFPINQLVLDCGFDSKMMTPLHHQQLKQLHQLGIRLMSDDSVRHGGSWQQLLRTEYEFIKLTPPVTAELMSNQDSFRMATLSHLMEGLQIELLFDGVANREQLRQIEEGCPNAYFSGIAIAPLMSIEQMHRYMSELNPSAQIEH